MSYTAVSDMKLLPLLCFLSPWIGPASVQLIKPRDVVTVSEGEDALLPCVLESGQNIDKFDWRKTNGEDEKKEVFFYEGGSHYRNGLQGQSEQFKERVWFFQHELSTGNASIKIKNSRLEDNGTYTCLLFKPNRQEFNIRLNVDGDLKPRNVTGAAPLPHIDQIPVENGQMLLKCKAHGVPKPELQWTSSTEGELLDSGEDQHVIVHEDASGRFHVELQLKVTNSDTYTCVVTQRDIFHQINHTAKVRIQDFVAVSEGEDAVLPCSVKRQKNTDNMEFSWSKNNKKMLFYDRGQVEENEQFTRMTLFLQELKTGNASIKIRKTQHSDSGHYSCYSSSIQKAHVVLQVIRNSGSPQTSLLFSVYLFTVYFVFWTE